MKKELKNIFIPFVMSVVFAFMLFIYEPIVTYSSNITDYWFDFKLLIVNNLKIFIVVLLLLLLLSFIIYYICKKIKKEYLYDIYLIVFFICLVSIYIQGNYLAGSLPSLDGSPIIWGSYKIENAISVGLWLIVILLSIYIYKKHKKIYKKIISYTSLGIFAMLLVSLISVLLTSKDVFKSKGVLFSMNDNINNVSKRENFFILLIDCVDSVEFNKVLKENNKEDIFDDFTYYPDTLSTYGFTRDSIPFILSGIWYEAETSYQDYYNYAFDNSKLFNLLKENNYDINVYDEELQILNNDTFDIKNIRNTNAKVNFKSFLFQETKYLLFKYLPYPLKRYSKIETLDYNKCKNIYDENNDNVFNWSNLNNYNLLDTVSFQKNNYFQFVHIEGGHLPYDLNEKMEKIENGSYDDKILSTITFIEKYLNRLKEKDVFDNSKIIILSDHGYNDYEYVGRQNPVLLIKGKNENHDLYISDKKVSYTDLSDSIYNDLINNKKSTELLANIDSNRIRRYLFYKEYDKMEEQLLDGNAWETDKLKPTGKKYYR